MADQKVHTYVTGASGWEMVVSHYGNGKGTREQFQKSNPDALLPIIGTLRDASTFALSTVHTDLGQIITSLNAAWRGDNADDAVTTLKALQTDANSISESTGTVSTYLNHFHKAWTDLKAQADGLGDDDDAQAKQIFNQYMQAENYCKDHWPNTLYYHEPLNTEGDFNPDPGPGGGPGGAPGPGGYPGGAPGPGGYPGGHPGPGGSGGPGPGPGGYPGGYPGNYPGGPGGSGPGGYPGSGDPTLDSGSTLASYDPGGIGGGGGGLGSGGGGLGAGGGLGGGGLGSDGGAGAGSGLAGGANGGGAGFGGGPGGAGAGAAAGRGMMSPMHGGGQGDEGERERNTWLTEDDDVWGADEASPGVIE
jgi:hypothetical protein